MGTFKAYFHKEMLESWRQYRYLVLGVGFILFAILDPVMLKLMPYLLEGQIPAELAKILSLEFTPVQAVQNYLGDLVEMVPLFTILGLMGVFADELREQRLVFPYSRGAHAGGMVLAKYAHYGLVLTAAILVGFLLNMFYANLLFAGQKVALRGILVSALLFIVFYLFITALLFLMSSLLRRGIVAAITVLILTYLSAIFAGMNSIARWIPYTLSSQANLFGHADAGLAAQTALITCGYIVLLLWLTIRRMRRVEVM